MRLPGASAGNALLTMEVIFEPRPSGTLVTVTHRGGSRIRSDHPARHGLQDPAFIRMMGVWWGELVTSMREHIQSGPDS